MYNYALQEIIFVPNMTQKSNDDDGAILFVYKNGMCRLCGIFNILVDNYGVLKKLFSIPYTIKKQHWFSITSTAGHGTYSCRLDMNGDAYLWTAEEKLPVSGIYMIDTVFSC